MGEKLVEHLGSGPAVLPGARRRRRAPTSSNASALAGMSSENAYRVHGDADGEPFSARRSRGVTREADREPVQEDMGSLLGRSRRGRPLGGRPIRGRHALASLWPSRWGSAALTFIDSVRQNARRADVCGRRVIADRVNAMRGRRPCAAAARWRWRSSSGSSTHLQAARRPGSPVLGLGIGIRYDSAHLIAAQLLFAYAFDMLLTWSRRDAYVLIWSLPCDLQHQPVPLSKPIGSTSSLMVAAAAKELIRWDKEGRSVHLFQPASFRSVFSLGLLLTGRSNLTWGQDIASTQFYPPHVYLMRYFDWPAGPIFRRDDDDDVGGGNDLPVRLLARGDGHLLFHDSYIPIAVFPGMHLLFTDPSTSPRAPSWDA